MMREGAVQELFFESARSWGLVVAYVVTASQEASERVVAEALVAAVARAAAEPSREPGAAVRDGGGAELKERLARAILEACRAQAFRGPAVGDAFFSLAPLARSIVALKVAARFSREQIARVTGRSPAEVAAHLESARLAFTSGAPWLDSSGAPVAVSKDSWSPSCPYWKGTAPRSEEDAPEIQELFSQYLEGDLQPGVASALHLHLNACSACRANFARFKRLHGEWAASVPSPDSPAGFVRALRGYERLAWRLRLDSHPRLLPAVRAVLRDPRALAAIAVVLAAVSAALLR